MMKIIKKKNYVKTHIFQLITFAGGLLGAIRDIEMRVRSQMYRGFVKASQPKFHELFPFN